MKKIFTLLSITVLTSCTSDDSKDCECLGKFGNTKTGETLTQITDCDKTPPSEDWIFLDCIDETPAY